MGCTSSSSIVKDFFNIRLRIIENISIKSHNYGLSEVVPVLIKESTDIDNKKELFSIW